MVKQLDGREAAATVRAGLKREIEKLSGRAPGLAFILIGDNPASKSYVSMKIKGCHEVGILSRPIDLPHNISEAKLVETIEELNSDPTIDGILVQQPLPDHIDLMRVVSTIDPSKDVDGFHPINLGKMMIGDFSAMIPCTPLGILKLLEINKIDATSKEVVIIGRSNIVGKPLASLLMQKKEGCNATVTVVHSRSRSLVESCQRADILIAAIGRAQSITSQHVKDGAIVIDVGINRVEEGEKQRIVGDVDYDSASEKASYITPVPGGVGPMTIAMLLSNTLKSRLNR